MKLIYCDEYDLHLGAHVFPSSKYRLVYEKLLEGGVIRPEDVLRPEPASDDDLLRVHHSDYLDRLKTGTLSYEEILRMEVPYSPELVRAVWLAAGGSILAGKFALADLVATNLTGGFHHAFPGHGEGFCVIHDVAVAIRSLQAEHSIKTAMTVDCDVHQGNGTAFIFRDDPTVFTFSIHQQRNYPEPKPPSDLDVNLEDGTGDDAYLSALESALDQCFARFQPDLVFYLAGADPYRDDQLGGLSLSVEGLARRDRAVFQKAAEKRVPVAVTLAGGYARRLEDTVLIHFNTLRIAAEFARGSSR